MENIWSFLLQTLSVSLIGLLLLVVKLLLRMFARWPDELIHDWTTASGVL